MIFQSCHHPASVDENHTESIWAFSSSALGLWNDLPQSLREPVFLSLSLTTWHLSKLVFESVIVTSSTVSVCLSLTLSISLSVSLTLPLCLSHFLSPPPTPTPPTPLWLSVSTETASVHHHDDLLFEPYDCWPSMGIVYLLTQVFTFYRYTTKHLQDESTPRAIKTILAWWHTLACGLQFFVSGYHLYDYARLGTMFTALASHVCMAMQS